MSLQQEKGWVNLLEQNAGVSFKRLKWDNICQGMKWDIIYKRRKLDKNGNSKKSAWICESINAGVSLQENEVGLNLQEDEVGCNLQENEVG